MTRRPALPENGRRVRAVDEGSDLAAGDGAFERAFGEEVEDEDGDLVLLAERERELCFEGKRWWDLVRYCYRGMDGVDITQTMKTPPAAPALRKTMTEFITRKYKAGEGDAVSYKMDSEPYLYWPVSESELKVNNQLKQNPVWIQEKTTSKN